ncbi:MAG: NADAR family protein [Desulfobulbaceae bacterium]|nr:NADAR family protein [Desulfobulbaceae bacterium]
MIYELHKQNFEIDKCAVFRRTRDEFGALSNMAKGFPISFMGETWDSSEALYQSFRFPDKPGIKEEIRLAESPMESKRVSRSFDSLTRPDWEVIRGKAMRLSLISKFSQNPQALEVLKSTGHKMIVEYSVHDDFWGAHPTEDENILHGFNMLGRLLVEVRNNWP